MRPRHLVLIGIVVGVCTSAARAQTVVGAAGGDIKNAFGDMLGVWVSPFRAQGRDWLTAAGALGFAAAISPWDDDVDHWVATRPNSAIWSPFKELRQGGAAFSGQGIVPVVAGLWLTGLAINNRSIRDGVMGCGASYAASSVVRTYVVYPVLQRQRPDSSRFHATVAPPAEQGDQYDIRAGGGEWGMQSTPGGHLANVAACAAFLSTRFHLGIVEPLLGVVVAGVGVARIADRAHWTSDQVLGALFGYAVGREVGRRSLARIARERADTSGSGSASTSGAPSAMTPRQREFFLTPVAGGFAAGWRATF